MIKLLDLIVALVRYYLCCSLHLLIMAGVKLSSSGAYLLVAAPGYEVSFLMQNFVVCGLIRQNRH